MADDRRPDAWRFTDYFWAARERPDRAAIDLDWIIRTADAPEHRVVQGDGRIRCWRRTPEAEGRWLRVVVLADGLTIHNAFFDRGFAP